MVKNLQKFACVLALASVASLAETTQRKPAQKADTCWPVTVGKPIEVHFYPNDKVVGHLSPRFLVAQNGQSIYQATIQGLANEEYAAAVLSFQSKALDLVNAALTKASGSKTVKLCEQSFKEVIATTILEREIYFGGSVKDAMLADALPGLFSTK